MYLVTSPIKIYTITIINTETIMTFNIFNNYYHLFLLLLCPKDKHFGDLGIV